MGQVIRMTGGKRQILTIGFCGKKVRASGGRNVVARKVVSAFFFFVALALMLLAAPLFAQQDYPRDINYCWNLPTKYVDNTDIQPGDLASTRIVTERQDGTVVLDELVPVGTLLPGERQCRTFVGVIPQPGTYTGVAYAITVDDISSDASGAAVKKFTGKPLPPQNYE